MATTQERHWPIGWIVIAAILVLWIVAANSDNAPASPPTYNPPTSSGSGFDADTGLTGGGPGDSYGYDSDTGYENPASGDDGSYDCPPGGGPVIVAPGDPAGLDGDGDGIGCE